MIGKWHFLCTLYNPAYLNTYNNSGAVKRVFYHLPKLHFKSRLGILYTKRVKSNLSVRRTHHKKAITLKPETSGMLRKHMIYFDINLAKSTVHWILQFLINKWKRLVWNSPDNHEDLLVLKKKRKNKYKWKGFQKKHPLNIPCNSL